MDRYIPNNQKDLQMSTSRGRSSQPTRRSQANNEASPNRTRARPLIPTALEDKIASMPPELRRKIQDIEGSGRAIPYDREIIKFLGPELHADFLAAYLSRNPVRIMMYKMKHDWYADPRGSESDPPIEEIVDHVQVMHAVFSPIKKPGPQNGEHLPKAELLQAILATAQKMPQLRQLNVELDVDARGYEIQFGISLPDALFNGEEGLRILDVLRVPIFVRIKDFTDQWLNRTFDPKGQYVWMYEWHRVNGWVKFPVKQTPVNQLKVVQWPDASRGIRGDWVHGGA